VCGSPWERRAEVGEGEHRQGDQRVWAVEAEGAAGDQPDLGVDRLDARVGSIRRLRVKARI
jgi:hypothetical protein